MSYLYLKLEKQSRPIHILDCLLLRIQLDIMEEERYFPFHQIRKNYVFDGHS